MKNKNRLIEKDLNIAKGLVFNLETAVLKKTNKIKCLKAWTKEEVDFLVQNWGILSKKEISEHIHKSINAICVKAQRIGLRDFFYNSEFVTMNELSRIVNHRPMDTYVQEMWLNNDFPMQKVVTKATAEYKCVKIADFIEWFKDHLELVDLALTEEGCFDIKEPQWLKTKRIADKRAYAYRCRDWTSEDDKTLKKMVESQKYNIDEICKTLKRTNGAVKRRMQDLKFQKRPPKKKRCFWTESEIKTVKKMFLSGFKPCVIAEDLKDRSEAQVTGIIERYNYFGKPPKKYGENYYENYKKNKAITG